MSMSEYASKINTIDIIIRNIEGGFAGPKPANYISSIYGIKRLAAYDISNISSSVLAEIKEYLSNPTAATEAGLELKL